MCDENFDLWAWILAWRRHTGRNADRAAHRVRLGFKRGKLSYIDENVNLSAAQSHSVFEKTEGANFDGARAFDIENRNST